MSVYYVIVHFGPCNSFHTVQHRPQRLRGFKDQLLKLGYCVKLVPVRFENYCVVEMCGHEVFRCNVQNLQFNVSPDMDPTCQRAIEAVLHATASLTRAQDYQYFWSLLEYLLIRGEYGPKDYWLSESINEKPFASCLDCVNCCNILVQKKTE